MPIQCIENLRRRQCGDGFLDASIPIQRAIDHKVGQQPSGKCAVLCPRDLTRFEKPFFGRTDFLIGESGRERLPDFLPHKVFDAFPVLWCVNRGHAELGLFVLAACRQVGADAVGEAFLFANPVG